MQEQTDSITSVLTRAEQAHGAVFHYVGGDDADWASFYSDFLVNHLPLPAMLATPPTRGHLTAALIDAGARSWIATSGTPAIYLDDGTARYVWYGLQNSISFGLGD